MEPLSLPRRTRQRGTALFVALIMLVAMSIAAVALVRSVDTTVVISGNLAFQQAALQAADYGIEAAVQDLKANTREKEWKVAGNCTLPDVSTTISNYYPTMFISTPSATTTEVGRPTIDGVTYNYAGVPSLDWDVVPCVADNAIPDGYRVQYVIDRLCKPIDKQVTNLATECVSDNPEEGGTRRAGQTTFRGAQSILYRLTVRVSGPNNAQSFVQVTLRD